MGSGPTLVMPPGGLTHLDWYLGGSVAQEAFCQRLAEVRTLVMYDRHGCGLSDRNRTDFTLEDDMMDIEAVVDAVGATKIDLFGVSWGGTPCLTYAARHPDRVRRMILYGTFSQGRTGPGELEEEKLAALRALRKTDWELYNKTQANRFFPSGAERETLESLARMLSDSTTPEMADQLEQASADTQSVLEDITTPSLVLHRRGDEVVPFVWGQYMARRIPDCSFMPLDGDAHFPWVHADQVLPPTIEFLTGVEYTAPATESMPPAGNATLVSEPASKTFASGRYVAQRLLGQGAQKTVYLVDDTTLDRQCAVATLNPALLDENDRQRIKQEAQTIAQFGAHSNIVTVYDFGEEDGAPYIVSEYVPGGELRAELAAAGGPLSPERALEVATDICRALSFAHSRGIVHRDLKPENVWLTEDRKAKLGDFGVALSTGRARVTVPGAVTGTAMYMAPEQATGGDVDARSDLYAFGVLLYELVTGRPPFVGDDPNAIMYQHVNVEAESSAQRNASVPPSIDRLIMKLLAKNKAERPGTADEVLAELERAAAEPVSAPSGMSAIFFLDIADSTALTTKLGDAAYRERERGLDALLRRAITDAGGTPVEGKVLGDGIMSVFSSARQAIEAAQRCRALGNEAGLPLHLGIHAGDVVREGKNVHGGAVQVAARVQGVAEPGEVLVSQTVRDLARTSAGVAFEDRGEHELKGIAEPQRLFAVRASEEDDQQS